ncbi:hypothetical protein MY011_19200 [Escherichia coli]|nr:hypothetical protein BW79_19945 [Escherichia coli O119:H4 str. 03-3458]KJW56405.1 hypothetical protein UN94_28000 [Escherichia coli]EYZ96228.1 hypothetical protein BW79_08700 [Escherichia coli O119:H4 str. 03-3458]KJW65648.1 hypothetical protein UN93_12275 [Escherichia coli]BEA41285.1 hypothetical protein VEE08_31620 [Escherichia coli]
MTHSLADFCSEYSNTTGRATATRFAFRPGGYVDDLRFSGTQCQKTPHKGRLCVYKVWYMIYSNHNGS